MKKEIDKLVYSVRIIATIGFKGLIVKPEFNFLNTNDDICKSYIENQIVESEIVKEGTLINVDVDYFNYIENKDNLEDYIYNRVISSKTFSDFIDICMKKHTRLIYKNCDIEMYMDETVNDNPKIIYK